MDTGNDEYTQLLAKSMKLPFFGKKEKKEYFLSLLLREEKITAAIFEESTGKAHVISKHEEQIDNLETIPYEQFLELLDKIISIAESNLPETIEVQKTIFGVKENWVEGEKIKKEYLLRLKRVSDALGLTPIGFLVIHEAVAHLLQLEEGAPVSGILVEIEKNSLSISLLRAGRIIETKRTKIEEDIAKITDRLLHHFTNYEVLPSRIIVLSDRNEHESLSQAFIGHTWSKSLPFLHVPQITILPESFDSKAVIYGAATQMGFEILQETTPEIKEKAEIEEDFGFLKEEDIKQKENIEEEIVQEDTTPEASSLQTIIRLSMFTFLKNIHPPSLPNMSFLGKMGKRRIFIIIPASIAILIAILVLYVFLQKATVFLTIKPKIIEQNQSVIFSTKNETDISKYVIAAEPVSVTEEGKITKETTGKKEIGEKAKGSITIYSTFQKEQTFNKGITITSANDLIFVLDETVKVASASGASDAQKVKAQVIAKNIGKEFNLPSGMKFTVSSFDTSAVEAKNDAPFSGGTKKEVTVVSQKDIDAAISELTKNLEDKAKGDLTTKIDKAKKLLPIIINTEFSQKSADKKIDEEAKNLTIVGGITYTSLSYKNDDIETLTKNLLQQQGQNNTFIQDDLTYELRDSKEKNTTEVASTLYTKAYLLPKLDVKKIQKTIAGNKFDDAKKIILKLPQVSDIEIQLNPKLPFLPALLPRLPDNITIVVEKE